MKKINLIIVSVLLVLAAGGIYYFYFFNINSYPDFVITITDEGFNPSSIKILKGTKVIFVNEGSNLHWPASDFHPTHGIYPEFDPLDGIPSGGRWSVVLKPGKWRYHDHLYPNFIGTIEVENE